VLQDHATGLLGISDSSDPITGYVFHTICGYGIANGGQSKHIQVCLSNA
jgi:hypothetical protein